MNYEKAYNEALERAKDIKSGKVKLDEGEPVTDYIFPVLKESMDEKIKKWIADELKDSLHDIELLYSGDYDNRDEGDMIRENYLRKAIAWLEKQGNIDKASYEIAEKEKREFVGDGFIKCYADFQDFKEGETYWLEYVNNDNYNVRSDNLLAKTYHITPCQLYTIFKKMTWLEKQGVTKFKVGDVIRQTDKPEYTYTIREIKNGCYICDTCDFSIDNPLLELVKKKECSEEDELMYLAVNQTFDTVGNIGTIAIQRDWLKSLKQRIGG